MTDTPSSGNAESADSADNGTDKYMVPALERGLRLLACFTPSQPVWSAPDLARTLALPRSTVFRMLTTLEGMGYLQRSGTEYRLGLAVLRLGYDYLSTQPLAQLVAASGVELSAVIIRRHAVGFVDHDQIPVAGVQQR